MVVVAGVGVRLLLLAPELALPADRHQDGLLAGPERGHQPHHRAGLQRTTVRTDTTYRLFSYHVLHSIVVSETSHFPLPIQSLQSPGAVQCGCWRGTGRGTRAGRRWCRWRGCSPRSGTRSSPTTGRVSASAAVRCGAASCAHLSGRGELCAEDVASLGQWRFKLTAEDGSMLTESGARDMLGLGQS